RAGCVKRSADAPPAAATKRPANHGPPASVVRAGHFPGLSCFARRIRLQQPNSRGPPRRRPGFRTVSTRSMNVVLRSKRWLALVFVVGLALPAVGQDSAELKWKFKKDETFYQEMTTTTKQTMKVMGMEITQNHTQTFWFSWTPVEEDKDKNWRVKQKIIGVNM